MASVAIRATLSESNDRIRCPYCDEEIRPSAKKCKHCGEWLEHRESLWHKLFNPSGRSSRSEYAPVFFVSFVGSWIAVLAMTMVLASVLDAVSRWLVVLLAVLCTVAVVVQCVAHLRRLHDIGRSGWNVFWMFVPLVGAVCLLYLLLAEGDKPDRQRLGRISRLAVEGVISLVGLLSLAGILWAIIDSLGKQYITIAQVTTFLVSFGLIWADMEVAALAGVNRK